LNGPLPLGTGAAAVSSAPATSQAVDGAHAPGEGAFFALLLGDVGKSMTPGLGLADAVDKSSLPLDPGQEAEDVLQQDAASLAGQAAYPGGLGWMIFSMMQAPADSVISAQSSRPITALGQDPLPASLFNVQEGQVATAEKKPQEVLDEASIPVDADLQALLDTQERFPAGLADAARGQAGQRALVSSEDGLPLLSAERSMFPRSESKDADPSQITTAVMARPLETSSRMVSDAAPVFTLPRALHHPEWAGDVGERVMWMCQADVKSAHLRLDPPHLGEIEVRITLHDEGAEVWFSTPSASVREALETALPRLRDLFTQQGLQLNQSGVSAEGGGRDSPAFTRPEPPTGRSRSVADLVSPSVDLDLMRHGGLFEAYA